MLRGEALGDLCISRPKARLSWGIELPFDDRYVTYVWCRRADQLRQRPRGTCGPTSSTPAGRTREHLIGKDILKPHGVFWPTMLMAAGLPLFQAPARARLLDAAARARCRRASATSSARSR